MLQGSGEMEITITACLFAERNMYIYTGHEILISLHAGPKAIEIIADPVRSRVLLLFI
jgi:hypothetical protein